MLYFFYTSEFKDQIEDGDGNGADSFQFSVEMYGIGHRYRCGNLKLFAMECFRLRAKQAITRCPTGFLETIARLYNITTRQQCESKKYALRLLFRCRNRDGVMCPDPEIEMRGKPYSLRIDFASIRREQGLIRTDKMECGECGGGLTMRLIQTSRGRQHFGTCSGCKGSWTWTEAQPRD